MKILIVHDWLVSMRGGEAILEALLELVEQNYGKADIFTLVLNSEKISPFILSHKIITSPLQKIPFAKKTYRHFLPFLPYFIRFCPKKNYDFIISSSHCVAKGIPVFPLRPHISYIHAPMRYIWDRFEDYFSGFSLKTFAAHLCRKPLQIWDKKSSQHPDVLIANSQFIAEKIQLFYSRFAQVITPFCDLKQFTLSSKPREYYLVVSALVPYKRVDIAVQACIQLHLPLLIVGTGPEEKKLKKLAQNYPFISFVGHVESKKLASFYQKAKALLFPGVEDFGITPLEAMACGTPLIGLNQGGLKETATEKTAVFFSEQTAESCIEAITEFEGLTFDPQECRGQAEKFTKANFQKDFLDQIHLLLKKWSR